VKLGVASPLTVSRRYGAVKLTWADSDSPSAFIATTMYVYVDPAVTGASWNWPVSNGTEVTCWKSASTLLPFA
jgi:hypothetical protein